jgi:hypothetical protein
VLCEAVIASVVVAGVPEETLTELAEKAKLAAIEVVALIVKATGPVNPFAGVTVKVIPEAAVPELTFVEVVHGVRAKSAELDETKSVFSVPFELA